MIKSILEAFISSISLLIVIINITLFIKFNATFSSKENDKNDFEKVTQDGRFSFLSLIYFSIFLISEISI